MSYTVTIQPPAEADIESVYRYIRAGSRANADRWLVGLTDAIDSLATMPNRCGLARESREFAEETRQLIYGRRQNAYRVIFVVRGDRVIVLRVLHGARESLPAKELNP